MLSLDEFCIVTLSVDVSILLLGKINAWSGSEVSTVYLNVTSVPSKTFTF